MCSSEVKHTSQQNVPPAPVANNQRRHSHKNEIKTTPQPLLAQKEWGNRDAALSAPPEDPLGQESGHVGVRFCPLSSTQLPVDRRTCHLSFSLSYPVIKPVVPFSSGRATKPFIKTFWPELKD